ncbi:head GIN domain-containing protein [Pedobacter frigoris]|uniref:head GIN domain-containing protein n=1 Tax=Pedobacter frigoris TaxID=2571272 RepID=UPI00292DAF15|nr:head GIN domain-containing protein [Pedobacter frigoris]
MKHFILLACAAIVFTSCSKDRITASGDKITETRNPGNFTGVNGSGSSDIHVSYGSEYKVVLKGSDNLVPRFKTEVMNDILYLKYEHVNVHRDDIEIFVTLPLINYVSLSGSGEIDIKGAFPATNSFKANISGSGEVDVEDSFSADEVFVNISGSGEADLEKLEAKKADVDISGSGDAKIKVLDNLKARISGSGKIYYLGSPAIDSKISGSGKVIKL